MSLGSLSNVLKIFGGAEPSEEERNQLFKEALLMTLARAADSDTNVRPVEVETVRAAIKRATGEDVSEADVRVAAASALYERASLDDYLASLRRKLLPEERTTIMRCLTEVMKSDLRISSREIEFFDKVAIALGATPSELAGLQEEQ